MRIEFVIPVVIFTNLQIDLNYLSFFKTLCYHIYHFHFYFYINLPVVDIQWEENKKINWSLGLRQSTLVYFILLSVL